MSTKDDLKALYAKLAAEIADIDAKAEPLIAEGKRINAQIGPLQGRLRELSRELRQYRDDDYRAKKRLLGQLAVSLGGKVLKAEPGQ